MILAATPASAHVGIDELERESRASVERHPEDPAAHLQRAQILLAAGQWDAALDEAAAALARGADRDEVTAMRGAILLAAGRFRSAVLEFDRYLARQPDAAAVRFERGRALDGAGEHEAAARDFQQAIAGLPTARPEQVLIHRDALVALGRRAEAVSALDAGMARVGRVASLQLAAVDLELELGRYAAALARIDELLARGPATPALLARRGEILERAGRPEEARASYAQALALIGTRDGSRRVRAFDALRRRLETAVASLSPSGWAEGPERGMK